uniref:Mediator complex subunit 11 n=1 Tax=Rhabditophanes sp. KR3021 TaxID=114890 RepID=A0AC35TI47_9BILA
MNNLTQAMSLKQSTFSNALHQQQPPTPTQQPSVDLTTRLGKIDEVEKKVFELIKTTKSCLFELSKEKQLSKSKMDDAVGQFKKCITFIESELGANLTYMGNVCVGVDHQGSTFASEANVVAAKKVDEALVEALAKIQSRFFGHGEESRVDLDYYEPRKLFEETLSYSECKKQNLEMQMEGVRVEGGVNGVESIVESKENVERHDVALPNEEENGEKMEE